MRTARQRCGPCTPRAPLPARRWHHSRPKLAGHGARAATSAWRQPAALLGRLTWQLQAVSARSSPPWLANLTCSKKTELFSYDDLLFLCSFFEMPLTNGARSPVGAIGAAPNKMQTLFPVEPPIALQRLRPFILRTGGTVRDRVDTSHPGTTGSAGAGPSSLAQPHAQRWRRCGRWRCSGAGCGRCRLRGAAACPQYGLNSDRSLSLSRSWGRRARQGAAARRQRP